MSCLALPILRRRPGRAVARAIALGLGPALALGASVAQAHPHVFIDTGLRVETDAEGRITGIEVSWTYDELTTMLVFDDMRLDQDYTGTLTEDELRQLDGFDLNWVDGFEGDVYAEQEGRGLALGPPEGRGVSVSDARITTRHFRPLSSDAGAPGLPLILRAYDPTYFVAYDLQGGVSVPEGCQVSITPADLDRAYTMVEEALYGQPSTGTYDFPEIGEAFADKVVVQCDR